MSDFTHPIVGWLIAIVTILSILGCFWLIFANNIKKVEGEIESTGHVWDEDLEEFDNPLPRWWYYMFIFTLVFGLIYLALYPGLGAYKGLFGWTQIGQYEAESAEYDAKYSDLYAGYAATAIPELAKNTKAMKSGERIYASYCTVCHGSDARGSIGFPNLTDDDWLWGGTPEQIKASIMNGRTANMPARGGLPLTDDEVENVTDYVMSLAGRDVDQTASDLGKQVFGKICLACHLPTGTGNQALGAANLTDSSWLYGSSRSAILETIKNGRTGVMPAHGEFLGEDKVHLLSAYVYSLSH
ncbi:MAG: cytochrome-c oxidase, cbb3-type subunit III [Proteobacteria bacterium]|nr:cytochrome-c oxidase, cbb3-type subunit III [Pseudomonadota bacterium]